MAYLTYTEYEALGLSNLTPSEFNDLIGKASFVLDSQTRDFYQFADLESDMPYRKQKFKMAVALQVEYMHQSSATSTYEANTPQSWSIGRTSVSESSRYSNTGRNEAPTIVCEDAILALSGTGLLFRGVR